LPWGMLSTALWWTLRLKQLILFASSVMNFKTAHWQFRAHVDFSFPTSLICR